MRHLSRRRLHATLVLGTCLLSFGAAPTAEEAIEGGGVRYEASVGFHGWADLDDLEPVSPGDFHQSGYSLSGAAHWPLPRRGDSELRLGVDFGLFMNESDIVFISEQLISRGLYLTPSLKWKPGKNKRVSLDAGLGYYLVDIAEVVSDYGWFVETELWSASSFGGYVGGTWNFGQVTGVKRNGIILSLKIHFFDLGTVKDEDPSLPVRLGPDAGTLSGPVYQLQVGYRWE